MLGLETSSRLASVAIADGEKLLGEVTLDTRLSRTEKLHEIISRLLADLALKVSDIDIIAFSEGPGSFTGLRIGMAAALGLGYGADRPIVAVPSLEVIAYPWRHLGHPVVVLSGHRRGHLYLAAYQWADSRFRVILEPANRPEDEMLDAVTGLEADRLLFAGDALDSLAGAVQARLGERACLTPPEASRAAHVAALALDPSRPCWTGRDCEGRMPNYLRDADARKPRHRA